MTWVFLHIFTVLFCVALASHWYIQRWRADILADFPERSSLFREARNHLNGIQYWSTRSAWLCLVGIVASVVLLAIGVP